MTVEELEQLIKGDRNKLVQAMAPLDESQRKKLAKHAAGLYRAMRSQFVLQFSDPISGEALAVLGLCSWTQAKQVSLEWGHHGSNNDLAFRVLSDRRPEWIDQWVEKELRERSGDWLTVRRLVRAGACSRPTSDRYIVEMIRQDAGVQDYKVPLEDTLRQDSGLLSEEVWRIFEVDLSREWVFGGDMEEHPWLTALVTLAGTGELDRQRLLTVSLQALNRQVRLENTSFFYTLHEALQPTLDERVERQSLYLDLLSNAVPTVIGFSLNALKLLAESKRLDVYSFVSAVTPALDLRQKVHSMAAIRLLQLAAKQSPRHRPRIAIAAARGLAHPSADVQKACIGLIESTADGVDAALAEVIEAQLGATAASQRPRIEAILAKVRVASQASEPAPANPADESLESEIEAIPAEWRTLAGIDECLHALRDGSDLPPLCICPMSAPRLDPEAVLVPIATLDELIDRISAAVEELSDADELELLLDGMSRFADQTRIDFAARTAPLLKRLEDLRRSGRWVGGHFDPTMQFRSLLRAWLQRQPMQVERHGYLSLHHEGFIGARMAALSRRLLNGLAGPLLACPTHRGGWLDPRELVRRVRVWQQMPAGTWAETGVLNEARVPDRHDLIQALLRLAPDHRQAALQGAGDLEGEVGSAIRFALGKEERIGPSTDLWIASVRARDPWGTFPALAAMHGDLGPDGAAQAAYLWETRDARPVADWPSDGPRLDIQVVPLLRSEHLKLDRPLSLLNNILENAYVMDTMLNLRCRRAIWPANPDSSFRQGALAIVSRVNNPPSTFSPTATYLEPLFDPDVPFSEMAQLALAAALLARDAGTRGLAIDALIALIEDGRCTGDELGAIYGKLAKRKGMVRLNRLAESLAEAARVSPLHERRVARVLQATLAAFQRPAPGDLHHLLSALMEALIKMGEPLAPECRAVLQSVAGKGKTASLAASLLELQPGSHRDGHRRDAITLAVRGRIARAKRWAARCKS